MLTIYHRNGDRKRVHPVDVAGWLKNGWSDRPIASDSSPSRSARALGVSPRDDSSLLNINQASISEIASSLPGIGRVAAKKIIEARPILGKDDLVQLMPDRDWEEILPLITFEVEE